ncbi:sugar phosphate nucleotidyltransferase [Petrachloros mirabilis]
MISVHSSSIPSTLWGIVLAGGEGVRLKTFVREHIGTDAPKQFCAFMGTRTMLERTIRRAGLLIPMEQLAVIGTALHSRYMFQSLGSNPPGSVLLQPANRDTAPGILFPLVHILKQDPRALVAIFPSDHFVLPGRRLMHAVSRTADYLRQTRSNSPIILAAEATYPETEYGWIAAGTPIASDQEGSVFRVRQFAEKPSRSEAERMLTDRWLWNTMILVARASSLLDVFRSAVPELVAYFMTLQRYMGSRVEQAVADEIYRIIPSVNFSSAVFAHQPDQFLVSPTRQVHWSDWGHRDRIVQTISALCDTAYATASHSEHLGHPA